MAVITSGGLFGHGFARRSCWDNKGPGALIFAAAMCRPIISLSNSLGSMASRGNETMAKRQGVADVVTLAAIWNSRRTSGTNSSFKLMDQAAVDAAKVKAKPQQRPG